VVEGFDVRVTDAGRYILANVEGRAMPVTVEEYKARLAASLVQEAPTLEAFRACWVTPRCRRELLAGLPDGGRSAFLVQKLQEMTDCDLYDVLAELGYGLASKTRAERAAAFGYRHAGWLATLPESTRQTLVAMTEQFEQAGTDGLENPHIFELSSVKRAGGLAALKVLGNPHDVLLETKERLFAS
jgi:type I restriction enzyme R subunit